MLRLYANLSLIMACGLMTSGASLAEPTPPGYNWYADYQRTLDGFRQRVAEGKKSLEAEVRACKPIDMAKYEQLEKEIDTKLYEGNPRSAQDLDPELHAIEMDAWELLYQASAAAKKCGTANVQPSLAAMFPELRSDSYKPATNPYLPKEGDEHKPKLVGVILNPGTEGEHDGNMQSGPASDYVYNNPFVKSAMDEPRDQPADTKVEPKDLRGVGETFVPKMPGTAGEAEREMAANKDKPGMQVMVEQNLGCGENSMMCVANSGEEHDSSLQETKVQAHDLSGKPEIFNTDHKPASNFSVYQNAALRYDVARNHCDVAGMRAASAEMDAAFAKQQAYVDTAKEGGSLVRPADLAQAEYDLSVLDYYRKTHSLPGVRKDCPAGN